LASQSLTVPGWRRYRHKNLPVRRERHLLDAIKVAQKRLSTSSGLAIPEDNYPGLASRHKSLSAWRERRRGDPV
jgi:hypothetical protein